MGNLLSRTLTTQQRPKEKQRSSSTQPFFLPSSTISSLPPSSFPTSQHGDVSWKTLLSSNLTPTNSLTAGIATCPAGTGFLAHHRHEQAEIYLILEGKGVVKVDGVEREVGEGDLVYIPSNAEHGIKVVGNGDLRWFYCFAADKFEDVVYRFS